MDISNFQMGELIRDFKLIQGGNEMTTFTKGLVEINQEMKELLKQEKELSHKMQVTQMKLQTHLKDAGLPDTWTLTEALLLAIEQSKMTASLVSV